MSAFIAKDQERIGPPSERAREFLPEPYEPAGTQRAVASTVCAILGVDPPADAEEEPIAAAVEALAGTERLAHIVIDALGIATWKRYPNSARIVGRLAEVRYVEIQSVLPAITPVNFATIASGASPETHGITNREQQLTVDTTFARLQAAGKSSAVCGRALSTTGILLAPHSSNPGVAESNTDKEVMELFMARAGEQVDYILAQLLDVDEAGHLGGPFERYTNQALARTGFRVRNMLQAAAENGYALLLQGDHGQHDVEPEDDAPEDHKGTHNGRRQEDVRVPFIFLTNDELKQALEAA